MRARARVGASVRRVRSVRSGCSWWVAAPRLTCQVAGEELAFACECGCSPGVAHFVEHEGPHDHAEHASNVRHVEADSRCLMHRHGCARVVASKLLAPGEESARGV